VVTIETKNTDDKGAENPEHIRLKSLQVLHWRFLKSFWQLKLLALS